MSRYRAPNGELIIGTAEMVLCTANIDGISDDGMPDYTGDTDVHWDTQETQTKNGKILFVCESGDEWTFDQLNKVEDDE
jgi:hypothetical protein